MRGLASFVMQGILQATVVTVGFALLSFEMPPMSVLSAAAVGLATLRDGAKAGLAVLGTSAVIGGALGLIIAGNARVLGYLMLIWLPVWALSVVLRSTRSLNVTMQAGLAFGALIIAFVYLQTADQIAAWENLLTPVGQRLIDSQVFDQAQAESFVKRMAGWMTGVLAAGFFLQLVAGLLVARWWQATLYNPGGFRQEFHGFSLGRTLSAVGLALLGWVLLKGAHAPELVRYLALLLMAGFLVQGLAVVHGFVAQKGLHKAFLVMIYALMFFAMPYAELAVAVAGLMDPWIEFRPRVGGKAK